MCKVMTGLESVAVHSHAGVTNERQRTRDIFAFSIPPKYVCEMKPIEELIRWAFLKGFWMNNWAEPPQWMLGKDAKGLLATTIASLSSVCEEVEDECWKHSLLGNMHCDVWADDSHSNIRSSDSAARSPDTIGQCLLVQTRATADKTRELMTVVPGFPAREFSWNA